MGPSSFQAPWRKSLTSMMGLEASTFSSTLELLKDPPTMAKYLMAYLAVAVFPAPDSPLMISDWFLSSLQKAEVRQEGLGADLAVTGRHKPRSETLTRDAAPDPGVP